MPCVTLCFVAQFVLSSHCVDTQTQGVAPNSGGQSRTPASYRLGAGRHSAAEVRPLRCAVLFVARSLSVFFGLCGQVVVFFLFACLGHKLWKSNFLSLVPSAFSVRLCGQKAWSLLWSVACFRLPTNFENLNFLSLVPSAFSLRLCGQKAWSLLWSVVCFRLPTNFENLNFLSLVPSAFSLRLCGQKTWSLWSVEWCLPYWTGSASYTTYKTINRRSGSKLCKTILLGSPNHTSFLFPDSPFKFGGRNWVAKARTFCFLHLSRYICVFLCPLPKRTLDQSWFLGTYPPTPLLELPTKALTQTPILTIEKVEDREFLYHSRILGAYAPTPPSGLTLTLTQPQPKH